jgi:3',5'-cyclic AMP phosphodiesterase CpdA
LLSDTHIAADRTKVNRGANMTDNLTRVVSEVTRLGYRPAGAIVNGDAAFYNGQPGDYTLVGELLKPISEAGIPLHLTLGNHDDRDNFRAGLAKAAGRSPLTSKQVTVVPAARANWFLLDSLQKVAGTPGELGAEQLDWLAKGLDARADRPALIVVHHDPKLFEKVHPGLTDSEQLFAVITPRKHVKAVIFGHTHQWGHLERDGLHLVNLPPTAYLFNPLAPNGWVEAVLRDGGADLTLRGLDPKHRQFGQKLELKWR